MKIKISGKNVDMGKAFQEQATKLLINVIKKYIKNAISGSVILEKSEIGFLVKTRVALTQRIVLESKGRSSNAHAALDAAIDHAEKRLRRHKRRLKNHRTALGLDNNDIISAPMTIYQSSEQTNLNDDDDDHNADKDLLPIVADLSYDIELLAVDQAVMRLEFCGETMLMFRNAQNLGLNVVYFRNDKSIGWIDPRGNRELK